MRIQLTVNGTRHEVDDVWEGESLLYALRERMGLPGSKNACEQGECGSCTVYMDGVPVCSCLVAAGPGAGPRGHHGGGTRRPTRPCTRCSRPSSTSGAVQCGFCTPGLIVTTHDLLERNPSPSDPEIREALAGNLCRCTGYEKIMDAVRTAARGASDDHRRRACRHRHRCRVPGRLRRRRGQQDHRRRRRAGPVATTGARVVDGRGCLLTPGLVNTHHHLYQWVTRGLAVDDTLFEWLTTLYPVWAGIDEDAVRTAATGGAGRSWRRPAAPPRRDHHYVFPREGGDLLGAEIRAAQRGGPAVPPVPRLDGPRASATAACRPTTWSRTLDAILADVGGGHRPLARSVAGLDAARRARPVLAVLGAPASCMRDRPSWPASGRAAAHPPRRDDRRGGLLPRALRLLARWSTSRSSAGLGADVWFAHAIHLDDAAIETIGDTGTGVAHCPVVQRAARRRHRPHPRTCATPASRSGSASTARRRTRPARCSRSRATPCCSPAPVAARRR